jgi:hypothetical protein
MSVDVRDVLLVEDDETLYIPIEFETLEVFTCMTIMRINEEINSHIIKIWRAYWHSVPFWKIFGNRCRSMWGSYFWLNTTRLYTSHVELGTLGVFMCMYMTIIRINKEIDSHIIKIWRVFRRSVLFLKDFWETMSIGVRDVLLVEDDETLYIPRRVWNS